MTTPEAEPTQPESNAPVAEGQPRGEPPTARVSAAASSAVPAPPTQDRPTGEVPAPHEPPAPDGARATPPAPSEPPAPDGARAAPAPERPTASPAGDHPTAPPPNDGPAQPPAPEATQDATAPDAVTAGTPASDTTAQDAAAPGTPPAGAAAPEPSAQDAAAPGTPATDAAAPGAPADAAAPEPPAPDPPAPEAGAAGGPRGPRPEERLERAVRAAEQALIEYEIAVETFRIEVENFSRLHHQKLGPMYARLDELDAEIAEARAARSGSPDDLRAAKEARARVLPMPGVDELFDEWMDADGLSPEAYAMLTDQPVRPPERVRPSAEARKLYRELARAAHPDLAQDEGERARRDEFITRVNAAYSRGDTALLQELAAEWAAGPAPRERRPSPSDELYARLDWLTQRKELLSVVARELEESAIGSMLRMAPDDPDTLLDQIAEQLLAQVSEREAELAQLLGAVG